MNKYTIIHFIIGMISKSDDNVSNLFLAYQFAQLFLNVKVFLLEDKPYVEEGNNLEHTLKKIGEFILGRLF